MITFSASRLIDLFYACEDMAPWMSAALDDEKSCKEFKASVRWFLHTLHAARASKEESSDVAEAQEPIDGDGFCEAKVRRGTS